MRIALGVEYDGTDFFGWQRLSHGLTLQQALEDALSYVANHAVQVVCAGRTDAGVHARCQVIHFETHAVRSERAWVLGVTSRLPASMVVRWMQHVSDDFHARYSAVARRYRYTLCNRFVRPALMARYMTWERQPLDASRMHEALQGLLGEHDFSAFRTVACQAKHPRRTVHHASVRREGECVYVEIQANAFLHHMVRNIVGSLSMIGRGERDVTWLETLLIARQRALAGPTAPAEGLLFLGPCYPKHYALPDEVCLP